MIDPLLRFASVVALCATLAACSSTAPTPTPAVQRSTTPQPSGSAPASPTPSGSLGHVGLDTVCAATGDVELDTAVAGTDRLVLVHPPAAAAPGPSTGALHAARTLVIALHGNGGSAAGMPILTGLSDSSDQLGFTVVYPEGVDREWGIEMAGDQFRQDRELLDSIVDAFGAGGCIDVDRVVVTGFSLGGIFAHGLACTDAGRFHALVEVSSREAAEFVRGGPQVPQPCFAARAVTFVAYNSLQDQVIPYEAGHLFGWQFPSVEEWVGGWAKRNACSGGPQTTTANDRLDRLDWSGCGAPTVLYRIKAGYHTWFGGDPPLGGLAAEDVDPRETVERLVQGEAP